MRQRGDPMKALVFALMLAAPCGVLAGSLAEGIYRLRGSNPGSTEMSYGGTVTIEREGEAYRLTWRIGPSQTQEGVALFADDVLSVSYRDAGSGDAGVVQYRLTRPGFLEGRWTSFGGDGRYGLELLELQAPP